MGTLQQQSIIKGHHVARKPEELVLQNLFQTAANENAERTAIIYEGSNYFFHYLKNATEMLATLLYWRFLFLKS